MKNKSMQAVKSKGSQIEQLLAKAMYEKGLRYRKHCGDVFGKPDFCFKGKKLAVFVDGDFWHGKDWEIRKHDHKSNVSFWHAKIERNIERDREVNNALKTKGWKVIRFWGSTIKNNVENCAQQVYEEWKKH
jgi:DNA mismatch endonuclease Vsr